MKKAYNSPILECVGLQTVDIVTASVGGMNSPGFETDKEYGVFW